MKTSTIVWIVVVVIVVLAGAWYFMGSGSSSSAPEAATDTAGSEQGPAVQAGINGSVDQGNLGAPADGSGNVQQPQQTGTSY